MKLRDYAVEGFGFEEMFNEIEKFNLSSKLFEEKLSEPEDPKRKL